MAGQVTEVALIPLQSGATVEDFESSAGKTWKATIDTVKAQEGFQKCYYGREVENPNNLHFFVDWTDISCHKKFTASPIYPSFNQNLRSIIDGAATLNHASFTPHPPSAAVSNSTSPVTEILHAYLPAHSSVYEKNVTAGLDALKRSAKTCTAVASGWVVEEVSHATYFEEGQKGRVYVACIGWESVEAHMKFRDTEEFKNEIRPLLKEGTVGLKAVHTTFVEG